MEQNLRIKLMDTKYKRWYIAAETEDCILIYYGLPKYPEIKSTTSSEVIVINILKTPKPENFLPKSKEFRSAFRTKELAYGKSIDKARLICYTLNQNKIKL